MLRVYTAELLPTALRGSALGVISGVGYFGANVMPFMLKLVSFSYAIEEREELISVSPQLISIKRQY